MSLKRAKSRIAFVLLFPMLAILALLPFGLARAFIVYDPANHASNTKTSIETTLSQVLEYISLPSTAASTGTSAAANVTQTVSIGTPIGALGPDAAGKAADKCLITDTVSQGSKFVNQLKGVGLSYIGGGPADTASYTAQIAILQKQFLCLTFAKNALDKFPPTDLQTWLSKNQRLQIITGQIDTAKTRLDKIIELQKEGIKGQLKALAIRMTVTLTKDFTTQLVNNLVAKYKIPNFGSYGNILAGQLYAMDYIKNSYQGDDQEKAIVASLINVKFNNQPQMLTAAENLVAARAASKATDLTTTHLTDSDFYIKLANFGNPITDKNYLMSVYKQVADSVYAEGARAADQEIKTGQGFNSIRDCNGVVSARQQAENKMLALADQRVQAQTVYDYYQSPAGSSAKAEDVAKAKQSLDKINDQMVNLPAGNSDLLVKTCSALVNPGSAVSNEIGSLLKSQLEQSTKLNSDNLPFYMDFLGKMGTNLVENIISGKNIKSGLLQQFGLGNLGLAASQAAAIGTQTALDQLNKDKTQGEQNLAVGITPNLIISGDNFDPGQKFNFTVSFQTFGRQDDVATMVKKGLRLTVRPLDNSSGAINHALTADDVTKGKVELSDSAPAVTTKFVAEIFDSAGKLLGSSEDTVNVRTVVDGCEEDGTCVLGASVFRPLQPRGPVLVVAPRN